MSSAFPYEYQRPMPDVVLVCTRCKGGLIHTPNNADPFCPTKGCKSNGQRFINLETIERVLGRGEVLSLEVYLRNLQSAGPFLPPEALEQFRDEVPSEVAREPA